MTAKNKNAVARARVSGRTTKTPELSPEVRVMIDVRHQAEQRGDYEVLGRLVIIETAHGLIEFPAEHGEWAGPDIGWTLTPFNEAPPPEKPVEGASYYDVYSFGGSIDFNTLIVLGAWPGLPALRQTTGDPCNHCLHVCDICNGTGKKQCEGLDCGGRGFINGNWLSCPGPGCHAETGQFKPNCATCATSPIQGQIREQIVCPMCKGEKVIVCTGCKGTKKRSTGHVNGSLDWRLPACKACGGTGRKGKWIPQDLKKFTNAELKRPRGASDKTPWKLDMLALGPIHSFTIKDLATARLRLFEVSQDAAGDFLMLLVPKTVRANSRAYLVGGVVSERVAQRGEVA
jgi:hypothetical protein